MLKRIVASLFAFVIWHGVCLAQNAPSIIPNSHAVTGTFSGNGVSAPFSLTAGQKFNISINPTSAVGEIRLTKLFPGDTLWRPPTDTNGFNRYDWDFVAIPPGGYGVQGVAVTFEEIEPGVQFRLECLNYVSGIFSYRLSQ